MATCTALWLALQDGSRSYLERMKVASYLWKQEDVRRKGWALLVKWAFDEVCMVYNRKAKRTRPSREVCEQLWQLLSVMLESISTSGVEVWHGETSPNVHFFQSVCDVLNDIDSDSSGIHVQLVYHVLKCLDSILGASMLPPSLHKYDTVVSLLQSLLNLAVCSLKSYQTVDPEYPLCDIFQTLEKTLRYFVYLQGSHGNPKKSFTSICNQLLPSVLRVKYHSSRCSAALRKANCLCHCELANSQIKNLMTTLFNKEHLAEFTSAVVVTATVSTGPSQRRSATSYARVLFETLTKMIMTATSASSVDDDDSDQLSDEDHSAVIEALPDLYQCFLHQNRREETVSKVVEFKFLQKLVVLLDIEGKQLQSSPTDLAAAVESPSAGAMETDKGLDLEQILKHLLAIEENSERSSTKQQSMIRVLAKCLELVWKYNIYQIAEDRDAGGEQFDALQYLSINIIKGLNHNCVMESFDCLAMVTRLNHKLLEPWLPSLWLCLMVTHPTLGADPLGQECVTIFAKLRQLPQLITKLLEALDLLHEITTIPVSTSPIFTPSTEQSFADCVSKLPPGQLAEILELLLSYLKDKIANLGSRVPLDSSLPPLERAADLSRLVLSHLPAAASLWSGKQKDKAVQLLESLTCDVILPLLTACATHDFDARLSSVALLVSSECTNLLANLCHISPSLLPSQRQLKIVWNEELKIPVPEQWSGVFSIDKLNPLGHHLLHRMAILELRFHHDELPATPSQLLTFILSHPPAISDNTSTTWNGQLLDLVEENECVGYWSLLLSQLPFIYSHMTKEHLETVAKEMVKAVQLGARENDCVGQKLSVVDAISVFLESEGFVDMRVLQELILNEFCTNLSSCLKRSLPKALRKALKELMSSSEHLQESLLTSLCMVLQHGLGALRDPPTRERAAAMSQELFNKINIPLISQLIRNFPLGSLSQVSLLKSLLLFTVLHISTALSMHDKEYQEEAAAFLKELTYLLSWMIHSLTVMSVREKEAKLTRTSKRKKKRTSEPSSSEAEISDMLTAASELWTLFTLYTYEYMNLIQMFDVPADLLASTLVAVEISVSGLMKLGDYPNELLEKVVGDLQLKPKKSGSSSISSSAVAENCLYIIANVSCKLLSVSSSKHQRDSTGSKEEESHVFGLLEHTMTAIEKFLARKRKKLKPSAATSCNTAPLEVVNEHPVLMSTLALLLHNNPQLISERHEEIISLLCGSCEESYSPLVEKPHVQFALFCGISDVLSLPAATCTDRLHSSLHGEEDADTENMEVTTDEEKSNVGSETPLSLSWKRLQSVLGCMFSEALQLKSSNSHELLHCLECSSSTAKSSSHFEVGTGVSMFSAMCMQLSRTLSTLLTAASNEELHLIMEQLLCIKETYSLSSVLTFCFSWSVVVGNSRLPQEKRSLIRKYLQQVLSVCQSISIQYSSDIFAVFLTIQLVAQLVSIPTSIGLDHTSVLLALELCSFAAKLKAAAPNLVTASLVVAETDLLLGVLRQHVSVATSAPSPIVASVNKLLGIVIKLGQAVSTTAAASEVSGTSSADPGPSPALLEVSIHCATKLSRLMEMLSQKSSFTKLAVYIVHVFLTSSQGAVLNQDVKKALLSGVFHLLKLCTPKDIAFIKASIDAATRDSFQTLIEEYQRYHKFGGRV